MGTRCTAPRIVCIIPSIHRCSRSALLSFIAAFIQVNAPVAQLEYTYLPTVHFEVKRARRMFHSERPTLRFTRQYLRYASSFVCGVRYWLQHILGEAFDSGCKNGCRAAGAGGVARISGKPRRGARLRFAVQQALRELFDSPLSTTYLAEIYILDTLSIIICFNMFPPSTVSDRTSKS